MVTTTFYYGSKYSYSGYFIYIQSEYTIAPSFAARMIFIFNGNISLIRLYAGKNMKALHANLIVILFSASQILLCAQCQMERSSLVVIIIQYILQIFCFCFIILSNFKLLNLMCYDIRLLSFDKYCLFIHFVAFISFFVSFG